MTKRLATIAAVAFLALAPTAQAGWSINVAPRLSPLPHRSLTCVGSTISYCENPHSSSLTHSNNHARRPRCPRHVHLAYMLRHPVSKPPALHAFYGCQLWELDYEWHSVLRNNLPSVLATAIIGVTQT